MRANLIMILLTKECQVSEAAPIERGSTNLWGEGKHKIFYKAA
jgi:hypothetical protein